MKNEQNKRHLIKISPELHHRLNIMRVTLQLGTFDRTIKALLPYDETNVEAENLFFENLKKKIEAEKYDNRRESVQRSE